MTAPAKIAMRLYLGAALPSPAPEAVLRSLTSAQVIRKDNDPGGFQLTFNADRTKGAGADYGLLQSPLLKPGIRAVIAVQMNGTETILIDGFITNQELSHDRQFGGAALTVSGEDVSYAMDRVELSLEFPQMGDSMIVAAALAKYSAVAAPLVSPTATDLIPMEEERTPQQNSTDRAMVKQLAGVHGYIFCIQPTPVLGVNTAYWGPPRIGPTAPALTVDMGSATNVETLSFHQDASAPVLMYGFVQDRDTEEDMPLATTTSTRLPPLAADPALDVANPLQARRLFVDPRYGYLRAMADAQAVTDISTDRVVTATGVVDTTRYGAVLEAPGLVAVRGVGRSYDGRYYLPEVTHQFTRGTYRQSFTLTREGTGSTIERVA